MTVIRRLSSSKDDEISLKIKNTLQPYRLSLYLPSHEGKNFLCGQLVSQYFLIQERQPFSAAAQKRKIALLERFENLLHINNDPPFKFSPFSLEEEIIKRGISLLHPAIDHMRLLIRDIIKNTQQRAFVDDVYFLFFDNNNGFIHGKDTGEIPPEAMLALWKASARLEVPGRKEIFLKCYLLWSTSPF